MADEQTESTESTTPDSMDLNSLLDSMGGEVVVEQENLPVETATEEVADEPVEEEAVNPDEGEQDGEATPDAAAPADGLTREALLALPEDELAALLELVKEHATAKGVDTETPAPQPDPEVVQQAQQPVEPPQPRGPFRGFKRHDDDTLMDAEKYNEVEAHNQAAMIGYMHGPLMQEMIPTLATIMEVQFATMMAEHQYPELKGKTADLMGIIASERQKNPNRDVSEIAKDAMYRIVGTPTQKKAMSALEKLLPSLNKKLAAGESVAPNGARSTAAPAAPATPRAPKLSPKDALLADLESLLPQK